MRRDGEACGWRGPRRSTIAPPVDRSRDGQNPWPPRYPAATGECSSECPCFHRARCDAIVVVGEYSRSQPMSEASTHRPTIPTLVVEDSATTRAILRERLAKIGCRVVGEADTPAEGLKLLRELHPKLITLD